MISRRASSIVEAEFDALNTMGASLRAEGHHVINLGQGMPPFGPPAVAVEAFREALATPSAHKYSGNAGLPILREALSEQLRRWEGIDASPDEILISAGGNQAFMVALLTAVDAGDHVVLPAPYFANHEGAIRAVGAVPIEAPSRESEGFRVAWDTIVDHLTPQTRAVVLCSPSNPTGAQIGRADMVEIVERLAARRITVIADETYMHFVHAEDEPGEPHVSVAATPAWRDNVILTSSFSKSFGVTGWRVGYLIADAAVIEQALKVHDAMVICAPVPAQAGMAAAVQHDWHYAKKSSQGLAACRSALTAALAETTALSWTPTRGSFFGFLKVRGEVDTRRLSMDLLRRAHVVTIPGEAFGEAGRGYLRVSYGAVTPAELREGIERIAWYLTKRESVLDQSMPAGGGER